MATRNKSAHSAARRQYAALACVAGDREPMVMLVTSRDTGRWVLPKGWPKKHLSGAQTAAAEAFEEAGVIGEIDAAPVGLYSYHKRMPKGRTIDCSVDVFPMRVAQLLEDWPERGQRRRQLFTLSEAAGKVAESELTALLLRLAAGGAKTAA